MDLINSNLLNIIITFLEIKESFKLEFISKNISNLINNCEIWSYELDKYNIQSFLKNIYKSNSFTLYKTIFNKYCYFCKKTICNKYTKYNNYKICKHCDKNLIHIDVIKKTFNNSAISYKYNHIKLNYNKLCKKNIIDNIYCELYPFYNKYQYDNCKKDVKLHKIIYELNFRKKLLEDEFKKYNIKLPLHNNLCKRFILNRTNISKKCVIKSVLKELYIKEYTPYTSFYNYFFYTKKKNKFLADKLALNVIGNPNLNNIEEIWMNNINKS